MTKLAFVLGSNWLLSIAELLDYIQDRGFDGTLIDHSRNAAIVDIKLGYLGLEQPGWTKRISVGLNIKE